MLLIEDQPACRKASICVASFLRLTMWARLHTQFTHSVSRSLVTVTCHEHKYLPRPPCGSLGPEISTDPHLSPSGCSLCTDAPDDHGLYGTVELRMNSSKSSARVYRGPSHCDCASPERPLVTSCQLAPDSPIESSGYPLISWKKGAGAPISLQASRWRRLPHSSPPRRRRAPTRRPLPVHWRNSLMSRKGKRAIQGPPPGSLPSRAIAIYPLILLVGA